MATTIKAQLVSMELEVSDNRRRRKIHDATGVCEINGTSRSFQLNECYVGFNEPYEIKTTVDGINFESLKAIDTIIDFANLVVRYQELKAEAEVTKKENKEIADGKAYDTHPIRKFYLDRFPEWKISLSRVEYIEKCASYSSLYYLAVKKTVEEVSTEYTISMNDRGQFVLRTSASYDDIKKSKYIDQVRKAMDAHVAGQKEHKKIKETEKIRRTEVLSEIKDDLNMDVEAITERKYNNYGGRGGHSRSWDKKSFQVTLKKATEESDRKKITFNRTRDGNYSIDWFKVGNITADQMKQLVAIFKED